MTLHPMSDHTGSISASVGFGVSILTKLVSMTPELQAISLLVSIVAGVFSVVWYVRKFLRGK